MTDAVCFDYNGTLSLDEDVMYELLDAVLAEHGRPLPRELYFGDWIGLADEIARRWLGADARLAAEIAEERSPRYTSLPPGERLAPGALASVAAAAERAPVAVVTSLLRFEVEPVSRGERARRPRNCSSPVTTSSAPSPTTRRTASPWSGSASCGARVSKTRPRGSRPRRPRGFAAAGSPAHSTRSSCATPARMRSPTRSPGLVESLL